MQDPESILRPLKINDELKAQAWDAFMESADEDDLAERLKSVGISSDIKVQLWDMKYKAKSSQPVPNLPPGQPTIAQPRDIVSGLGREVVKNTKALGSAIMDTTTGKTAGTQPSEYDPMGLVGMAGPMSALQALKGVFGGTRAAQILQRGAQKQYAQVLGPTKETTKFITEESVPRLLNERVVAASRAGLQAKAQTAASNAGKLLEEAWAKIPDSTRIKTAPIVEALNQAKQQFIVEGKVFDPEHFGQLDTMQKTIAQYGDDLSAHSLRQMRQVWDKIIAKAGGFAGKNLESAPKLNAIEEATNAIRNELAKELPDIAKINAEFHFWRNVDSVLTQTIQRTQGQAKPLGEQLINAAAGGGILAGAGFQKPEVLITGGALVGLNKLVRSPGYKTVSAVTKNEIAKLLANGDFARAAAVIARASVSVGPRVSP